MSGQKYCVSYFGSNCVLFILGILENRKFTITNYQNKINLKEFKNLKISYFDFLDEPNLVCYINTKSDSNKYRLVNKLLENELIFIKNLSFESLKEAFINFNDFLLGDDIIFPNDLVYRKIKNYIDNSTTENIIPDLIPILYFVNCVNKYPKHDYDYSDCFSSVPFSSSISPYSQPGIPIRPSWF